MSGKNGIPTDKLSLPSLFSGETRLCSDKSPTLLLPTWGTTRTTAPRCPDDIVVADAGERAYTSESQMGWAAEIENMGRKGR